VLAVHGESLGIQTSQHPSAIRNRVALVSGGRHRDESSVIRNDGVLGLVIQRGTIALP